MAKKQPAAEDQTRDQTPDEQDESTQEAPPEPVKPAPAAALDLVDEAGKRTDAKSRDLLLEACDIYGINPEVFARPRELAAWRYYAGDRRDGRPDAVVLVTQGGVKIKHFADRTHPVDPETEERLRNLFGAWKIDPVTKLQVPGPMPDDLTLPAEAVTGMVTTDRHVYRRGYLREGGKSEGARRAVRSS